MDLVCQMLAPTSTLIGRSLGKRCSSDHGWSFSGATRGLRLVISPETAEGGNIALIEDGDEIVIDLQIVPLICLMMQPQNVRIFETFQIKNL